MSRLSDSYLEIAAYGGNGIMLVNACPRPIKQPPTFLIRIHSG